MCFLSDNRATYDIDALNPELDTDLQNASRQVGADNQLPAEWLNTDASAYADLSDPGFSARTIFTGEALRVESPDLEHLLAMKLLSARDKDLPDAAWLARKLDLGDRDALRRVVADTYELLPYLASSVEWASGYIDHVLTEIDMQQQFEAAQKAPPRKRRFRLRPDL